MRTPEEIFENHAAKVILDNDDYFILDWRKENGASDFYVNYILDRKNGSLHITGDLGACIVNLRKGITPEQVLDFMKNLFSFAYLFQCSTNDFIVTLDEIQKGLKNIKNKVLSTKCFWEDEVEENFKKLKEYYCLSLFEPTVDFSIPGFIELTEKYGNEWDFIEVGKEVHPRVKAWVKGYELAMAQLGRLSN